MEETKKTLTEADLVKQTRETLKAENDALEAEILRKEQLRSEAMKAGKSQINNNIPEVSEAEKKKAAAIEFFKGSDLERVVKKYG